MTHSTNRHRPFRQTTVQPVSLPPTTTGGGRKLPPSIAAQLQELEAADEWQQQCIDTRANSALIRSVAKGQGKTQRCRCCGEPFQQYRLKYGIPANRPFDTPEFYCPICFKQLNCKGV